MPDSLLKLPYQGKQSKSYEFQWRGKSYVLKELRHDNADYEHLGPDPAVVAKTSNEFYKLLKRHLGENVIDTWYVVAKDREGKPTVVAMQPKIEGENLLRLVMEGDGDVAVAMNGKVVEFERKLDKVFVDPDWTKLPLHAQNYFSATAREIKLDNVIRTPDNRFVLVDF